jgi:autotransporter-associated beta strand protein
MIMQTARIFKTAWLVATLSIAGWATTQAANIIKSDTTTMDVAADWSGTAPTSSSIGEFDATPLAGTLAAMTLGANTTLGGLQFDTIMTGPLLIASGNTLTIGAASANCIKMQSGSPGVTFNCALTLTAGANTWTVPSGSTLTINGTLTMGAGQVLTVADSGTVNGSALSFNTGNGTGGVIMTGSGTYSGLDLNIQKTSVSTTTVPTASSPVVPATTSGLYVNGPSMFLNTLEISSGNGGCSGRIDSGAVTVTNTVIIGRSSSGTRGAYFEVNGGSFTSTNTVNGVVLSPNNGTTVNLSEFYVAAGTATVGQLVFGASADTVGGTGFMLVKGGNLYVDNGGIVKSNTISAYTATVSLFSGLLGATANWTCPLPVAMSGSAGTPFTIQAANASSVAHNISLSGTVSGSGSIAKTGNGTLLLSGTNTYMGSTLVNAGRLVLDVNGSVASSKIIVGSGTTFDVSAVSGGFVLNSQTLSGSGVVTGAVSVASGATIDPGSNTLTGTLSFSNSVTEAGGAINHFDLAGAPSPNNDLVIIAGDFDVSGTNTVDIFGASLVAGTNYILIQYGGNLNGGLTNFALSISSPAGVLTNDPIAKTISFIPETVLRGPTNTVWIGNLVNTNWDNASSGGLEIFIAGDSVQFTDAGASNSPVNIVGVVQPASILVNSQSNYVFASTNGGWIGGVASLTVTNTGTLTIAVPTNTYTGNTTIAGGSTLVVAQVASAGLPSAIGEGNLIINNGTFSYAGSSSSVNLGATLGSVSSVINVASSTLTLGGALTGPGALTKTGNGQLTLNGTGNYIGGTLISAGTLRANPASAIGTNVLTLNGGATIANFQFAGDAQTLNGVLNIVGTNNSITVGGNDMVSVMTGSGKLNVEGTNVLLLTFQAADMTAFAGTIYWDTITTNRFFPSSGTSVNAPSTTFDLGIGSGVLFNRDGGNYHLGALQSSSPNTQVRGSNNSGSAGTTYYIGEKGLSTTFPGVIRTGTAGGSTSIVKLGADTFTLTGNNTYSGTTTISNGVLALVYNGSTDGSINSSATINVTPGAFIDVSGRSDQTLQLGTSAAQQLRGRGTINGNLNVGGSGTVAPGGGPGGDTGTLTVTNNINLGGTAWMKVNRASSPNSDQLVSSLGTINYGGTLVVTNIGAPLQKGDTFTLFNAKTLNGSDSSFTLNLPLYYTWDTSQLGVNGSVTVTGVLPPPAIVGVVYTSLANGSLFLNVTNGLSNGFLEVLTTTNISLPLSSWTTNASSVGAWFEADGTLVDPNTGTPGGITITVDTNLPQSFFVIKVHY